MIDTAKIIVLEGLRTVVYQEKTIVSIEPTTADDKNFSDRQYDLGERFLCPGLIDAHCHVCATPGVTVSFLAENDLRVSSLNHSNGRP